MKLIRNGKSFQIVLPAALVRAKRWEVGQQLVAVLDKKGRIIIQEEN